MSWWHRLWRRKQMEEQLDKELRFHLEQHASELISGGYDPAEARRLARLALGGPEQVKEQCRDVRGTRWVEDLLRDIHYALRAFRQQPAFAAVALLTLALGAGATTAMFTVLNGVVLKPLAYTQPDRLVSLQEQTDWSTQYGNRWAFAYPNFLDCRRESGSLAMAAWRYDGGTVSVRGSAEYVDGLEITANLFSVLGVPLVRGRSFLPAEDRPGGAPVAVISYGLWQRLYGGNPGAIGMPLDFEGKSYAIVGIAPQGFRISDDVFDVFMPLGSDPSPSMQDRGIHPRIQAWARLRPSVTLAQAQAELALIGHRLAAQYPKTNKGRTFVVEPLRPDIGDAASAIWLLMGAVSLVLLIACVNVASLLLARAVSREREMAMRAALGASRGRLMRQCLAESAVLGLFGGALGILIAAVGLQPLVALWPGSLPRAQEVRLDWHVLLFALAAGLLSGFLFGLAPALRVPLRELDRTLRAGARTIAGNSRRLHSAFVISELALAVILLVSAGILGRTFLRLSSVSPGVNVRNVLVCRMALSPAALASPAGIRAAWAQVLDHARAVPGVRQVALVDTVPLREGTNQIGYSTSPAMPPPDRMPLSLATSVTPEYLGVMGLHLREGRFFNDQDRRGSQRVVIIDQVLARSAFGEQDPLGKRLWFPASTSPFSSGTNQPDSARIVGVVGHVRQWGLAGDDRAKVRAQVYYPFAQVPDPLLRRWSELMSIAVRTSVAPLGVVEPLGRAVRGAAGDQALYEVRTMDQLAGDSLAQQRFLLLLLGIFAALALLLACVGIYGVLAYLNGRRAPEFGVRMALGADAGDVLRLVFRESLGMILIGVGAGIAGAWGAARLLEHFVVGVQSAEPMAFATMVGILVIAVLAASFLPARRASRIDPVQTLRQE